MVEVKRKHELPIILESKYTVPIHNQMQLIGEESKSKGKDIDYEAIYSKWKKWADDRYVRPLIARKKKLEEFQAQKIAQAKARRQAIKASKKQ
jgi:hypothetical protein